MQAETYATFASPAAQAMERLQATKTFLNGDVDVNSLLSSKK